MPASGGPCGPCWILRECARSGRADGGQPTRRFRARDPIVLDLDGVLIEGRNRWAACQIANVDPRFAVLDDNDPVAFILSKNTKRRHMTKGQIVMASVQSAKIALSNFDNLSQPELSVYLRIDQPRVAEARLVIDYAPDLVDGVIAGSPPLYKAVEEARRRKQAAESEEARLARLQAEAPDLAALVVEERMTLNQIAAP